MRDLEQEYKALKELTERQHKALEDITKILEGLKNE